MAVTVIIMSVKFVILVSVVMLILIGGYFYFIKPNTYKGLYLTPPIPTPSLNIYGKLLDYSENGGIGILKIEQEMRNYEINRSIVEIKVNLAALIDYAKLSGLIVSKEKIIRSIDDFEINKTYCFRAIHLADDCGQFLGVVDVEKSPAYYPDYKAFLFKYEANYTNYTDSQRFQLQHILLNSIEYMPLNEIKEMLEKTPPSNLPSDLIEGNKYVFYFYPRKISDEMELNEKELWTGLRISENLTEYKQERISYHKNDLIIDPLLTTEKGDDGELEPGQMRSERIIPTDVIMGELTELKILLINKQDNDIKYRITNAKMVNEQASQWYGSSWQLPPYEERLRNATINECSISFDSSQSIILAGSTKTLTFMVNCPEVVDITKNYEICDNYEERRNCRIETANRTDNLNYLMLWGEIEFVDELGNTHTFPENGVLKQFLNKV
jgi:DNA-binding transcriptional MerR regulator